MLAVIGKKVAQTQKFLTDGTRIPVTVVATPGNTVMMTKSMDKEGYISVQLGFGERKNANKPQLGHAKKALLTKAPLFMAEARMTDKDTLPQLGEAIAVGTVLEAGDIVDVRGKSKGKGFAGGVKRYGFRGGPKTHGQSDRHRAPGSIGSGTTPGRVYKGKRMAGKMGNDMTTLKNLEVVQVGKDYVWVKGVVPGPVGAVVIISPTGKKNKKFVEVLKSDAEKAEEVQAHAETAEPEVPNETEEIKGESDDVILGNKVTPESKEDAGQDGMTETEAPVVAAEVKEEPTVTEAEAPKEQEEVEEAMAEITEPKEESFLPEVKEEEAK